MKILRVPLSIVGFIYEAYRSKFNGFRNKFEVFKILFLLSIKSRINIPRDKIVFQDIFEFRVATYNYNTLLFLFREIFLSYDYYFKVNKNSPKIIDCGANIGMSILFFKKVYPDCEILAFEPNPSAFSLLQKNVSVNNLKNVTLFNFGLSDNEGTIEFYLGKEKGSLIGSILRERGGENVLRIKTCKLSNFILDKHYDLIKIDVEGAEWKIIQELCKSNLLNSSDKYIIEYHHRINHESSIFSKFISVFEEHQFDYNLRSHFVESNCFQDILINIYVDNAGNN